ncbi:hypothetical protein CBS101457_004719 [Exobasidium rhododendri]|nr:hypothetical protein CBS101457_004719 [Exobasidium rhododendri]
MSVANGNGKNLENGVGHMMAAKAEEGFGYRNASENDENTLARNITPGGHYSNDDLIAIGAGHRKIANPLPLGAMSFATTTLILSLYNLRVQGIVVPNAIVSFSLFFGGLTQFLAGVWEFASGNTLGASIFVCFGTFWWGFSMIFIPFFGETGTYDGVPGVYAATGASSGEFENAVGYLTFVLLGAFYYSGNTRLETAGGAMGVVTAFIAYYLAIGSLLTPSTSYFTLPLGSLAKEI